MRKFSPILVFVFFASVTIVLWRVQVDHYRQLVVRHVQSATEIAGIRIGSIMNANEATLGLLAARWVEDEGHDFSYKRFSDFARAIFKNYPGFSSVFLADTSGVIRYVFPQKAEADRLGKKITYVPGHKVSPCFDLSSGRKGFRIVLPLVSGGKLQGYLCGEFNIEDLINYAMPGKFIGDFVVDIDDQGQRIFHYGKKDLPTSRISSKREIAIGDRKWLLTMAGNHTLYADDTPHEVWVLVFGIILSAILSLLFYQLLQRMEAYRISRDLALDEISERKRVEAVLQEKEKRLKELVSELSEKNTELESFVYTISHDLKTPIVTIGGFIGALREDFGAAIPKEAESYLDYMSGAGRKMEALIDDLLELSRIGRMVAKRTTLPFGEIVEEAVETLRPNIEGRGIRINVQENLPRAYCEKNRMVQVMYNLINNAVKYMGEDNKSPCIEIGAQKQNERCVFFVRDNGIGIEKRFFEKIFRIFERLPSARKKEGTGVGLAIVKRIIEHHGGRIWLDSELGRGTTFFFTIGEKDL
ncbi:MAG: ATP-binding protein [Syntrophobacteraceae bacterium]